MGGTGLVTRSAAVESLLDRRRELLAGRDAESVTPDVVAGRTAASAVTAPASVPSADFATMDGFAFASGDEYPRSVVARVDPAGDPPALGVGEAVRVATGAPLPARADAVLPREDATVSDAGLTGPSLSPGTNLVRAGTTATEGEALFEAGDRLAPRHAALLRDVGVDEVAVHRRLSVGILATGTEIHEGTQPDRDSDVLANLVREWGHAPTLLGAVPDEEAAVYGAIERAADAHDLVLTSGGTGGSEGDHVGTALADHDRLFAGVALRPGRPTTAATVGGTLVCGLPGKPLAAHTAATLLVRPALTGETRLPTVTVPATSDVDLPSPDREYAVPVAFSDGQAEPVGHEDSDRPLYGTRFAPGRVAATTAISLADGFVLTTEPFESGDSVEVVPYEVVE
ncbi:molybdopterin molybdotransferase MoeA [Halorarum halobium]|uniref:molybdopterin molybdotransferase MoeA n=1 Tax=Halorarum halobium TaxID=3075121 RepID=UPI0028AF8656|nr:molybdopterin molybdotransferase MoeA [Halobaculum sp. XH14]